MKRNLLILIAVLFASTAIAGYFDVKIFNYDIFKINGTGALQVPVGTTLERPSEPEDGMIRRNSTTNGYEAYNASASAWGAIGGGGGSNYNVLGGSDFENTITDWTFTNTDCSIAYVDSVPHFKKSLEITCTAGEFNLSQTVTSMTGLKEQIYADVYVKTTADGVRSKILSDGVCVDDDNTCEYIINTSTKMRSYSIGTPTTGTSNGVSLSATSFTGVVTIDNFELNIDPSRISNVNGARFIGSAVYKNAGCLAQQTGTGTSVWFNFPPDADCVAINSGEVSGGTDFSVTFDAQSGTTYSVVLSAFMQAYNTSGQCRYSLSSVDNTYDNQATFLDDFAETGGISEVRGDFKFSTSGSKTIKLMTLKTSSGVRCNIYGQPTIEAKISVHAYSDLPQAILKQNTELTAKTANEFTGQLSGSSGSVARQNYTWAQSCTSQTSGSFTCTFVSDLFSDTPNIQLTSYRNTADGYITSCRVETASSTGFTGQCNRANTESIGENSDVFIELTRTTDTNKSIEMIGKFNQTSIAKNEDKYTETEKKWGFWNGEQLYRRCLSGSIADGTVVAADGTVVISQSGYFTSGGTTKNPIPFANASI